MNLLITIAAFLLAIGILVTIHELGHYWAARWCGVKILRFSIGFGRALWLRRIGPDQTEWVIALVPLGGYVKMADERDDTVEPAERDRAFNNKNVWQRMFIVVAGPVANFMLATLLYWTLFVSGIPGVKPYLAEPASKSEAAQAGFVELELLTRVGDRNVRTWSDARLALLEEAVKRSNVEVEIEDARGQRFSRMLDLGSVTKDDLDRDFLVKVGLMPYRLKVAPVVAEVTGNSAAARAGLEPGDRITAIDGKRVDRWEALVEAVSARADKVMDLTVDRAGRNLTITVTPERVSEGGKSFGRIGIKPVIDRKLADKMSIVVRYGPIEATGLAVKKVWEMSAFALKMMGRMLTGDVSWKNLSGPITIADVAGQTAMLGWIPYVNFLALISISLGVLNLLPIPVLDGGQLMYYMAELLKGSPVSDRMMQIGQQVGLALLLSLTAFAFYNDISRLLTG